MTTSRLRRRIGTHRVKHLSIESLEDRALLATVTPGIEFKTDDAITGADIQNSSNSGLGAFPNNSTQFNIPGLQTASMFVEAGNPIRLSATLNVRNPSTSTSQIEAQFVRVIGGSVEPVGIAQRFWLEARSNGPASEAHITLEELDFVPAGNHEFGVRVREVQGNSAQLEYSNSTAQNITVTEFNSVAGFGSTIEFAERDVITGTDIQNYSHPDLGQFPNNSTQFNIPGLQTVPMFVEAGNPIRLSATLNVRNPSTSTSQIEAQFVRVMGGLVEPVGIAQRFWLEARSNGPASEAHITLEDFDFVPSGNHEFGVRVREVQGNSAQLEFSNSTAQNITVTEFNTVEGFGPTIEFTEGDVITGVDIQNSSNSGLGAFPNNSTQFNIPGLQTASIFVDAGNPIRLSATLNVRNPSTSTSQIEAQFVRVVGGLVEPVGIAQRFWLEARSNGPASEAHITLEDFDFVPSGDHQFGVRIREVQGNSAQLEFSNSTAQNITVTEFNRIVTNQGPVAIVNGPYSITEGGALALSSAGSMDPDGSIVSYLWDLNGDGTFGDVTGANPVVPWSILESLSPAIRDDGTYTVALRVTDDNGATSGAFTSLSVANTAPTLTISGADSVNEGSTYTLDLSSSDPGDDTIIQWEINWGDGSPVQTVAGNPTSVTHTYVDGPRNYTILATATDEDGTYEAMRTITVNNVAPVVNAGTDRTVNEGDTVDFSGAFSDVSSVDTHTIEWDFGDGNSASGTLTPSHVYSDNGTYSVTLTVTDDDGAATSETITVTVNNVAPSVVGAISETATEDATSFSVDLLQGATDPGTSDVLSVDALTLASGDASGVTFGTNSLTIDPSAYNHLAAGESETIVYSFNVVDGNGGSVPQTATITVTGANDGPSVAGVIAETASEDAASFSVDLLQGASDPDASDVLNVAGLTLDSGDASGVTVDTNSLTIDLSAYNHLAAGESETIVYRFNVVDGNGGSVSQTATITVTGANDGPSVAGAISETASEDAASFSVDLLQGASDPDATDVLSVNGMNLDSGDASGVTVGTNSLTIDPSAYNHLAAGESETIVYSFNVVDGNGGTVSQTATITVTGANDGPSVAGLISETASEDAASFSVDLLQGASDPDTSDVLNVDALTLASGDASGVTVGSNSLTIDSSAYNHLAAGESETIVYSFNVVDGNGGTVSQTATITVTGANDGPSVAGVISETASEDAASFSVDLLQGASDPDTSDVLNVDALTPVSGDASGVTVGANSLTIDPSAYNHLAAGESETIVYSFSVVDGNGGTVSQTATITVTGANDGPSVAGLISETTSEDAASFSVDLLQGASDPDATDVLNVAGLTLDSGDASGVTVGTNSLTIDPSAYNHLAVGESETIIYSFNVADGNGGTVSQTATITVTGANDGPSVAGVISETASEDVASFSVDLLQGASDPDASDVLNVAGLTLDSGDASGVTVGTNGLTIDPSAYNHLAAGESETIVYSFNVVDGNGGSVSQTATITVTGANDGPSVAGLISETTSEDAASFSVDLLQGASDPDLSDVLNVAGLTLDSGDASGVTVGANSLTIDPSAYNHLAAGESETITYSFNVVDGNGGTVSQTATITVTGANDGPSVAGVISETTRNSHFINNQAEDDAAAIDFYNSVDLTIINTQIIDNQSGGTLVNNNTGIVGAVRVVDTISSTTGATSVLFNEVVLMGNTIRGLANTTANGTALAVSDGAANGITVEIQDSTIADNLQQNGGTGFGGGVALADVSAFMLTNSTVSGNQATLRGGGISASDTTLIITDSVISGNSAADDGGGIYGTNGPVTLQGTVVSGNSAGDFGGGVSVFVGEISVTNSTISDNTASNQGGGISANRGDLTVLESTISRNSANRGGGIRSFIANITLTRSELSDNFAYAYGGGVNTVGSSPSDLGNVNIIDSTVSGNTTGGFGRGGGVNAYGDVYVQGSTISGNVAYNGGGIFANRSFHEVEVNNSTVSGNSAAAYSFLPGRGAGIYAYRVTLNQSTVSGNNSEGYGGGIWASYVTLNQSTVTGNSSSSYGGGVSAYYELTIRGSIVAGNLSDTSGPDLFTAYATSTSEYSLIGDNSDSGLNEAPLGLPDANGNLIGGPVNGLIQPMLAPLDDNGGATWTHKLLPGSPAIDAGNPSAIAGMSDVPEFDQRGLPFGRVEDGTANNSARIDMGALELQPIVSIDGDFNNDGNYDCLDIDALVAEIASGMNNPLYDLTADNLVDLEDRDAWLAEAALFNGLGSPYKLGDADLDGFVDGNDFLAWNANKFTPLAEWCAGDFTADGFVDGNDFLAWNANKFTSSDGQSAGFQITPPVVDQQRMPLGRVEDGGGNMPAHLDVGAQELAEYDDLTLRSVIARVPPSYPRPVRHIDAVFASAKVGDEAPEHSESGLFWTFRVL